MIPMDVAQNSLQMIIETWSIFLTASSGVLDLYGCVLLNV